MKRKGIAIIDVLIALIIITIVGLFIGKYIMGILEINKQMDLSDKFQQISADIQNALQNKKNIKYYSITPRGVFALNTSNLQGNSGTGTLSDFYNGDSDVIYFNYEKAVYGCYPTGEGGACSNINEQANDASGISTANENLFSTIYHFTFYDFSQNDSVRLKKQELFWNIPESLIREYGEIPLLFVMQRYANYDGYKYPYKIFSLVDLGPMLYRKLEAYLKENQGNENAVRMMAFLFPVTDNGVTVRNIIHFDKIKQNDPDFYQQLQKLFGSNPERVFDRNKKYIKLKIFNTMPYIESIVKDTVQKMRVIQKNIQDWGTIQARIAAYDSLNGNNMDKDYFITCTGNGCQTTNYSVDKTRTLKPRLLDNATICNPKAETCSDTQVDETELNNGFFVCTLNSTSPNGDPQTYFMGYHCPEQTPNVISGDICVDQETIGENLQDESPEIEVDSAVRFDVPDNTQICLLSEADRRFLSSTGFAKNYFGIPLYFSNSNSITIKDLANDLLNNSEAQGSYVIQQNIPIQDSTNNPPYNAGIFTIMPWFIGGYEKNGYPYADVYENQTSDNSFSGFGIIYMPVFAHVF